MNIRMISRFIKLTVPFLFIILLFISCAGTQANNNSRDANDANMMAQDAGRRLDAALGGGSVSSGSSGGSTAAANDSTSRNTGRMSSVPAPQAQETRGGAQPAWVSNPYTVYNKDFFVAAVGSGANRSEAGAKALGELAAIFGRSIRAEYTVTQNYTEAVNRRIVNVSANTNVREQIATAASMNNLVSAEIGNVWDSGRGAFYAAAFLDIERAIAIYSDMIMLNNENIDMLTDMTNAKKNTLDGYARYKLASQIAGINSNYAAIIKQLGGSTSRLNLKTPESFNLEASNIIRSITVLVSVKGDRANRIQNAFAQVLGGEGLRTRGNNPLYTLEAEVFTSEVSYPSGSNDYKWCRIEISSNLIETSTGASLLAFPLNDRAGHTTYANAENTAFVSAERIIADRYAAALREYLASLIPLN